jgi:hypothetical protein
MEEGDTRETRVFEKKKKIRRKKKLEHMVSKEPCTREQQRGGKPVGEEGSGRRCG